MLLIKQFESEMTLWDVNGITLKKKAQKIKIQVEYMRNLVRRFMLQQNLVNQIQNLTKLLRLVLERAKTYSVPNHIIEKAIDKAKGAGDENFDHLRYEGFGPSGSMLIVDALTNNVNRTASDVRAAFGKTAVIWVYLDQLHICLTMWQRLVLKVKLLTIYLKH